MCVRERGRTVEALECGLDGVCESARVRERECESECACERVRADHIDAGGWTR